MKPILPLALLAAAPLVAAPASLSAQTVAAVPAGIAVRDNGLVATWYPPASGKRGPVILVLGGSEGGEDGSKRLGARLAAHGYGVLSLAYFKAEGLPPQLQEIPLEYFDKAVDWLKAQPLADAAHIGLYGISKGGETALLLASRHREFSAVVAAVPSSLVWQGINFNDYTSVKSSFSLAGQPVPFLPYDTSAPFSGILDLYQRSLKHVREHPDAVIPVERIAGAVLLLSGKSDTLWPSSEMADQVMARLDASHFRYPHRHIAYPQAGHGGVLPPSDVPAQNAMMDGLGGTPEGNAAARADAWAQTLAFFDTALGGPR
jgi:dienelactone hydrolase